MASFDEASALHHAVESYNSTTELRVRGGLTRSDFLLMRLGKEIHYGDKLEQRQRRGTILKDGIESERQGSLRCFEYVQVISKFLTCWN